MFVKFKRKYYRIWTGINLNIDKLRQQNNNNLNIHSYQYDKMQKK